MESPVPVYKYDQASFGEIPEHAKVYLYEHHSQYRNWQFSPEELQVKRQGLQDRARKAFLANVEREKQARVNKNRIAREADPDAPLPFDEDGVEANYFSLEEEKELYLFYEYNIQKLASKNGWSDTVKVPPD